MRKSRKLNFVPTVENFFIFYNIFFILEKKDRYILLFALYRMCDLKLEIIDDRIVEL